MKRTILAAATALTVFGAVASPASAQTWNHNQGGYNNNDRGRDNNDRRGDNYRRDDNRGQWQNQGRNDYRNQGYRNWRRGDRMSAYEMRRYRDVDYRRHHLRAPPRGYRYVEDDRGDTILVGIATGVILSILLSQ
jgi:Ni/Co efflux regulator RcnB